MHILFFAHLKDAVGCSAVDWQVGGPLNTAEVWDRLVREFPELSGHRASTRLARNGAYVSDEEVFQAGDEVALIPPVSGG
jgi:molybdopterin converting factor subunit 1